MKKSQGYIMIHLLYEFWEKFILIITNSIKSMFLSVSKLSDLQCFQLKSFLLLNLPGWNLRHQNITSTLIKLKLKNTIRELKFITTVTIFRRCERSKIHFWYNNIFYRDFSIHCKYVPNTHSACAIINNTLTHVLYLYLYL